MADPAQPQFSSQSNRRIFLTCFGYTFFVLLCVSCVVPGGVLSAENGREHFVQRTKYHCFSPRHDLWTFHFVTALAQWQCLLRCGDIHPCPGPNRSTLMCLNTCSLPSKVPEIANIIRRKKPALFGICETWLDNEFNDNSIAIDGYTCVRRDRNRQGGGVCAYIRHDLRFTNRTDIDNGVEAIWLDFHLPRSKPFTVCIAYRPPSSRDFYQKLGLCLSKYSEQSEIIILGDLNADVQSVIPVPSRKDFDELCDDFNFTQLIEEPTRVTSTSSTCIDLILAKDPTRISRTEVIKIGISDHFLISCERTNTVQSDKSRQVGHNTLTVRSLACYSPAALIQGLERVDWNCVFLSTNVNNAWANFCTCFKTVLESVAPFKTIRVKKNNPPWFSSDIRMEISERDRLLRKSLSSNDENDRIAFRAQRALVQDIVKNAKQDFYRNKIKSESNQPKKLWNTLRTLGATTSGSKGPVQYNLKIGDQFIQDDASVADIFNEHFCNISKKLTEDMPESASDTSFYEYYNNLGVARDSFSLSAIERDVVLKHLKSINISKATGLDGIPGRFLRDAAEVVAAPLTHIFNLSLSSSIVPDDFKLAKVTPLYKGKSHADPNNYRPISVLSVMSKILERIVYDQVQSYLDERKIIYPFQSGFRKSFSTNTTLLYLTDYIRNSMDEKKLTGVLLLDLKKAFDTVNHNIMVKKLSAIGMDDQAVEWFVSYLQKRTQIVQINGKRSLPRNIESGVPQGSILGPMLYSIYINDLPSVLSGGCRLLLYADDSALYFSASNIDLIRQCLNTNLRQVQDWLISNKLVLHPGKTESILFGSRYLLSECQSLSISLGDKQIEEKTSIKYLGAILDKTLSGEEMASNVLKKVRARTKLIRRVAPMLDQNTLLLLSNAIVQPHFDYACNYWYPSLNKATRDSLQRAQNILIRIILSLSPRTTLESYHFKKVNWLTVENRVKFQNLSLAHKCLTYSAPSYLTEQFHFRNNQHNTRSGESSLLVAKRSCYIENTFHFNACNFWNNLPMRLRDVSLSNVAFKKAVKGHFLISN